MTELSAPKGVHSKGAISCGALKENHFKFILNVDSLFLFELVTNVSRTDSNVKFKTESLPEHERSSISFADCRATVYV